MNIRPLRESRKVTLAPVRWPVVALAKLGQAMIFYQTLSMDGVFRRMQAVPSGPKRIKARNISCAQTAKLSVYWANLQENGSPGIPNRRAILITNQAGPLQGHKTNKAKICLKKSLNYG
jgi:hypothetical protein